jgi:hypothetical protein
MLIHLFAEETRKKYNLESLWAMRPSAEDLALTGALVGLFCFCCFIQKRLFNTGDTDWEVDLFPEFGEEEMEENYAELHGTKKNNRKKIQ